jgi:hypothetical protein
MLLELLAATSAVDEGVDFWEFDDLPGRHRRQSSDSPERIHPPTRAERFAARTARALELRRDGATLAAIGAELGVTRERVRQMLAKVDAPSREEVQAHRAGARALELEAVRKGYVEFLRERPPMTLSEAATALGVERSHLADLMDDTLRRLVLPDPKPSQVQWSRGHVMEVLREAATFEFPLTTKGYERLLQGKMIEGPSVPRICQVFDGWAAACEAAGVESGARVRTHYSSRWTDDDVLDAVRRYLRQAGRPTFSGYSAWAAEQDDRPSGQTVRNRLGRWTEIVRMVHEADYSGKSHDV